MTIVSPSAVSQTLNIIHGKVAVDPFLRLPDLICQEILRFASSSYDLRISRLVNKRWGGLSIGVKPIVQADEKALIYRTTAFSKLKWNLHFGRGTVEGDDFSPLPQDIGTILSSPCKAFPGRKIVDTHILVYLPESINLPNAEGLLERVPFTLNNLGRLMQSKLENSTNGFRHMWREVMTQEENKPLGESRWVLMTKDVLLESRTRSYRSHALMVDDLAVRARQPYKIPRLIEIATCIYMWYVNSGERLFSDNPWTYVRCKENGEGCRRLVIGGFTSAGLNGCQSSYDNESVGVAAALC